MSLADSPARKPAARPEPAGERGSPAGAPGTDRNGINLLLLNSHLPVFPGGGGVEYLTTRNLAGLAAHVGLVSMAHTRPDLEKVQGLADAGVELYLWEGPEVDGPTRQPRPSTLLRAAARHVHSRVRQAAHRWRAGRHRPADTVILDGCFRNMSAGLVDALSRRHWHVLAVVESSAAAMIDSVPRPLVSVLVMHDVRALMYERWSRVASSFWRRRHLRREARRYEAFERRYCQLYDLVTTVSEEDAAWVRERYRPSRVITVPLPVDATYFRPGPPEEEVPGRIVFTGLMSHPPNADGAVFFAREVLPRVRVAVEKAELFIVGRHPTPEVLSLGGLPGVTVTGEVPDVRPFLTRASVVVVPLRYGSGARQKILEAWSMERCVVSTTVGAEGLSYRDGGNLVIADGAPAQAEAVTRLLREPTLRDRVRFEGRSTVLARHDPARIASDYFAQLREVATQKAARDEPMRVAIDLHWMIPGRAGGVEHLARAFLGELLSLDRHNAYRLLLPARCRHDFDLRRHPNFKTVSPDGARAQWRRVRRGLSRRLHAALRLDHWDSAEVVRLRHLRELDAEIAYSFPGYVHPDLYPLRQVVTVPDIQHEFFPEFFSEADLAGRQRLYGEAIRRADHICAISEFTRRTLIERLGVDPAKVSAVPLAADSIFTAAVTPDDEARLKHHRLSAGGYLFFPAHTWHHKNHRTALRALRILRDRHGLRPLLVCSGGAREAQPAIESQISLDGLEAQVRFVGHVPRGDLPFLYRHAAALVFPSLFEGFGMPVLEAMACGCPVVCSSTTSLPEVAGPAARLVDPRDAEALADALRLVLGDSDLRTQMQQRGFEQAARFSWRRHVVDTVSILHRVHQGARRL